MLETDWSKPRSGALARLSDPRARQYWDPQRSVGALLKQSEDAFHLHPECCEDQGVLWDMAAVYAPSEQWGDALPKPALFDGTVVDVANRLEAALAAAPHNR